MVIAMMARLMLWLIGLYRRHLSKAKKTSTCRFIPSCSQYAVEAIQRHGALRGGALALWRILRCNPLGKWGYDPVPETFKFFHRKERNL